MPDSSMQRRRRVVITGIGVVSPNGVGADTFATSCTAGRSGIFALPEFPDGNLKSSAAAQVRDFDPTTFMDFAEARRVPRMVHLALAASREALASSNF
ncbi:MAG: beta-ketoacyl-[acyl-carrier-protein] synthase II, partial [Anaerolineae bacterium]|nr:beta-ketoacyl-[acyl-carrier-protein] synthase II [Phycisphaerae bacterium]